jgi:hypothetical protein
MAGYLVQVRFADGTLEEGDSQMYFRPHGTLSVSSITGWRYIRKSKSLN